MKYIHHLKLDGKDVTLTWVGRTCAVPARVYALAFTSPREMLLVSGGPGDPDRWLPGGGVEPGETAEEALRRELARRLEGLPEDTEIVRIRPEGWSAPLPQKAVAEEGEPYTVEEANNLSQE